MLLVCCSIREAAVGASWRRALTSEAFVSKSGISVKCVRWQPRDWLQLVAFKSQATKIENRELRRMMIQGLLPRYPILGIWGKASVIYSLGN